MKPIGKKFKSFEEAEKAEKAYMQSLTPQERFDIAFEIIKQVHGDLSQYPDVKEFERKKNEH